MRKWSIESKSVGHWIDAHIVAKQCQEEAEKRFDLDPKFPLMDRSVSIATAGLIAAADSKGCIQWELLVDLMDDADDTELMKRLMDRDSLIALREMGELGRIQGLPKSVRHVARELIEMLPLDLAIPSLALPAIGLER